MQGPGQYQQQGYEDYQGGQGYDYYDDGSGEMALTLPVEVAFPQALVGSIQMALHGAVGHLARMEEGRHLQWTCLRKLSNQMGAMDISQRPRMPVDRHSDGAQRGGMRPPEGIQSPTDGMRGLPPPGLPRGFDEGRRGSEPAPGPGFGPAGQGQGKRLWTSISKHDDANERPGTATGTHASATTDALWARPCAHRPRESIQTKGRPLSLDTAAVQAMEMVLNPLGHGRRLAPPTMTSLIATVVARRAMEITHLDLQMIWDTIMDRPARPPWEVPWIRMRAPGAPNGPLPPGPVPQALNIPRTKSQPNLRNGQPVFEMSGDIPPMPNMPGQPGGGPANPDALPSHPTPVRPGLMADSVVNVANKPPPVRTYGTSSPAPTMNSGPPSTATPSEPPPDPVTSEELERLRVIVKADPNDQETGLRFAKRLVEAADVLVPNVADPKTRARSRDRYLADAYKVLKKLANAQNKEAMFFFADCIGRSLFSNDPDHKEAFTLYQSAAKLGHAAAAYRTAVCCEIGHEDGGGTRKDPLKAIQWYKRAATLGDTPAMYKMGMIQLKGLLGQPKNPREAIGWLKRAADQSTGENPHALHELGLLYESAQPNDVIIRDEKYAFTLFKKAAELGYKFSQFRLGCAYEYGLMGCPIDPRLSIMWYSKAAMQEEHQAELALSGWYLTGSEGVLAQSDTEAYLWARKAAMAGLAKAEYAMGYFTEDGIGVPANMEDAKRWYWRAAAQDFPKARERLEDLKRSGKNGPRQRERISRSKMNKQQEGECSVM
ncbi:unnamed protein product [Parascedosporium putredinis]|uniref:HCP-like protein n=1 Tax=Parascedosporium putredinis TaxID=1442378 RepID=A0A9P1GV24_9PEZI|nr:unnamed protein product [Parascedosporium putredinis]CAI7987876.1 unnamed protein product [Parascedosporium putredinis]